MKVAILPQTSGTRAQAATPDRVPGPEIEFNPQYPAQVIIYEPVQPTVIEGSAFPGPDGSMEIVIPIASPPPAGYPVQIIIYDAPKPTVIGGTTSAPDPEGGFTVVPLP